MRGVFNTLQVSEDWLCAFGIAACGVHGLIVDGGHLECHGSGLGIGGGEVEHYLFYTGFA